ncbi:MAG: hypothetical protein IJU16_05080, partial [Clostridia bacterium]|nr:hypothetical protein [Clostridia bacterium]
EWNEQYKAKARPVEIVSDGFHLVGEYFDFGGKKAVIIVPGRTESYLYSYYFAEPYRAAGYNVLVIDNRAHGLSDGKYVSLGFREYRDLLGWAALLHDELGNEAVLFHGICIGSSASLFALTAPDAPDYLAGLVAEGMYVTFYESFKNHMIEQKRPLFPYALEVMGYLRVIAGAKPVTDGPIKRIGQLKKPILFLHSREDQYSTPEKAEELYAACTAPKTLMWFEHGAHSRIRVNNVEGYDAAIRTFLESL